jgi:hypothetical protein
MLTPGEFLDIRRNIVLRNSCEVGLAVLFNYVVNRRTRRRNVHDGRLVAFFSATHVGNTFLSDKFQRIAFGICTEKQVVVIYIVNVINLRFYENLCSSCRVVACGLMEW